MSAPGVTIAVTDHAIERFRQRVGARRGDVGARTELAARVAEAWRAGRVSDLPPDSGRTRRGTVYVADLVDRDVLFVCRHDRRAGELVVVTLWERERLGSARVARRYTDGPDARQRGR